MITFDRNAAGTRGALDHAVAPAGFKLRWRSAWLRW
jgi:hypothetical protein